MAVEQRVQKRLSCRFPVLYGQERAEHRGCTTNLSRDGFEIAGETPLTKGTLVELVLIASREQRLTCQAVVRWTTLGDQRRDQAGMLHQMGLELLDPLDEYLKLLESLQAGFVERRSEPRLNKVFKVTFSWSGGQADGYTQNVSAKGLFVVTRSLPRMDTELRLSLELDDGLPPVIAKARVIGIVDELMARESGMNPGLGLELVKFEADGDSRLGEYLERLQRR